MTTVNKNQNTTTQHCLWLDFGNSNLKLWLTQNSTHTNIDNKYSLEHWRQQHSQTEAQIIQQHQNIAYKNTNLENILQQVEHTVLHYIQQGINLKQINISCVLGVTFINNLQQLFNRHNLNAQFAHVQNLPFFTTQYDTTQLGLDRWLQVLALSQLNTPYLLIGCGTALTADVVQNNTHIGGYIVPNFALQSAALNKGTKQINIATQIPTHFNLATNTQSAVNTGVMLSLCAYVLQLQQNHAHCQTILTGGSANSMLALIKQINPNFAGIEVQNLVFWGMQKYFNNVSSA